LLPRSVPRSEMLPYDAPDAACRRRARAARALRPQMPVDVRWAAARGA